MIDPPKPPEPDPNPGTAREKSGRVNDADVHAMEALLNRQESGKELSSLFSSQVRRVRKGDKRPGGRDDLDERLRHYRENRENQDRDQARHGEEEPLDDGCAEALAEEVAEHILISDKAYMDPGAVNEVRIKIKETILKDAHIHLVREKDCLQVKLISSSEQSVQTLVAARHRLEKQLEKNYKGLINITIVHVNEKGDA